MASRGRGRGLLSDSKKNECPVKKSPKSIDELARYLRSLDEKNVEVYGVEFASMVRKYADNEGRLVEAIELIFNTTVANRDYSILGCSVCYFIIHEGPSDERTNKFGSEFLQKLLKHFQSEVQTKNEIRSKSIEQWLGVFAFLCEIYRKIKIGGKPITVVGKSILQNIEEMLNSLDTIDDEIDTICTKLRVCGKLLDEQNSDFMEKVLVGLRRQIISNKSSCQRRCLIMEVLELKQLGWVDKSGHLNRFYADALADAIAEDELGCKG